MEEKLLNLKEVLSMVKISRSALYVRMTSGTFPKPLNLNGRRVAWLESDIENWIKSLIDARKLDSHE